MRFIGWLPWCSSGNAHTSFICYKFDGTIHSWHITAAVNQVKWRMVQVSLYCVLLALMAVTVTAQRTNFSNILRGRDGIPGRDGRDGRDGLQGPIGPQGPIGVRGEKGHPGEFPGKKGDKGVPGVMGYKGEKGRAGEKGNMGEKGHKGDVGPNGLKGEPEDFPGQKGDKGDAGSSGVTYIRWGRTVCPQGTSLVYTGVAAGTQYNTKGGTSDTLCLAGNPQYKSADRSSSNAAKLSGVQNEVTGSPATPLQNRFHTYLPCALCYTTTKSTSFMMPGRYTCPSGWSTEYSGYIMTEYTQNGRGRRDTICVDQDDEAAATKSSAHPAMLYLMQATCIGLNCPPFNSQKPLTCVVCSK